MSDKKQTTPYYSTPLGGHPPQTDLLTDRAVFTEAYAVIPKKTMRDIVTSNLPFWEQTRAWVLSRPLSGFAETFSQYIMEVGETGGSDRPETEQGIEHVLFVVAGQMSLVIDGEDHALSAGTVSAMARRAAVAKRPLLVLWLDAQPDFHTLDTTTSGHLHGTFWR